jgi:hypothetical protein
MDSGDLGWFIAQRVVEGHGGRIRVESGEGNNAFSIELPIEEERRTTVMLGRDALTEPPTQLLTSCDRSPIAAHGDDAGARSGWQRTGNGLPHEMTMSPAASDRHIPSAARLGAERRRSRLLSANELEAS